MSSPRPENPLYITQSKGQRPRQQRRSIARNNRTVACSGTGILCNELLHLAACLVKGGRDAYTTSSAGIAGIKDVGAGADSRGNDDHTVEVVQQQERVHEVDQVREEVGEGERGGCPEEGVRVDDDHDEADVIGVELRMSGAHGLRRRRCSRIGAGGGRSCGWGGGAGGAAAVAAVGSGGARARARGCL